MTDNIEIIIYNECANSGDKIYTYFNDVVGAMEAFGYSAFLAARHIDEVLCLWDNNINLPCAVLRKEQMNALRRLGDVDEQALTADCVQVNLSAPQPYDKKGYDRWMEVLKARKVKVATPLPVDEVLDGIEPGARVNGNAHAPFMGSHMKNETAVTIIAIVFALLVAGLIYMFGK